MVLAEGLKDLGWEEGERAGMSREEGKLAVSFATGAADTRRAQDGGGASALLQVKGHTQE